MLSFRHVCFFLEIWASCSYWAIDVFTSELHYFVIGIPIVKYMKSSFDYSLFVSTEGFYKGTVWRQSVFWGDFSLDLKIENNRKVIIKFWNIIIHITIKKITTVRKQLIYFTMFRSDKCLESIDRLKCVWYESFRSTFLFNFNY